MDQWLIRTATNWVAGPYSKDQVCQMILDGKLKPEDEVCSANSYWIYLYEREEVKEQLGIEPPQTAHPSDDDITETQTRTEVDATDPALTRGDEKEIPDLAMSGEEIIEETKVLMRESSREARSVKKKPSETPQSPEKPKLVTSPAQAENQVMHPLPRIQIKGQIEKSSLLRGLMWFTLIIAILFVSAVVILWTQY